MPNLQPQSAPQQPMSPEESQLPSEETVGAVQPTQKTPYTINPPDDDGTPEADMDDFRARMGAVEEYDRRTGEMSNRMKAEADASRDLLARAFFQILVENGVDPGNGEQVSQFLSQLQESDPDMFVVLMRTLEMIAPKEGEGEGQGMPSVPETTPTDLNMEEGVQEPVPPAEDNASQA